MHYRKYFLMAHGVRKYFPTSICHKITLIIPPTPPPALFVFRSIHHLATFCSAKLHLVVIYANFTCFNFSPSASCRFRLFKTLLDCRSTVEPRWDEERAGRDGSFLMRTPDALQPPVLRLLRGTPWAWRIRVCSSCIILCAAVEANKFLRRLKLLD